jgi:hypothetical protein
MSSEPQAWGAIESRVANALGPEWDAGTVSAIDSENNICPRHVSDKKSWFAMQWSCSDDEAVARGAGDVIAVGQAKGWDFTHTGALDAVLGSIRDELARPREPKRSAFRRLFGR